MHQKAKVSFEVCQHRAGQYNMAELLIRFWWAEPTLRRTLPGNDCFTKRPPPVHGRIEQGYAFIAMPMDPEHPALIDVLEAVEEACEKCGPFLLGILRN